MEYWLPGRIVIGRGDGCRNQNGQEDEHIDQTSFENGRHMWVAWRRVEGKLGPAGIGGMLDNSDVKVLAMFSKDVGCMESNEANVLANVEVGL